MRIWSLHPTYLDSKGLVALWREALLAKKVLRGRTRGYKHHPQLERFRKSGKPLDSINHYLAEVYREATERNYNFNRSKVNWNFEAVIMPVTSGQIAFEAQHLLTKLKVRDKEQYKRLKSEKQLLPHPIFRIIHGGVEPWERL